MRSPGPVRSSTRRMRLGACSGSIRDRGCRPRRRLDSCGPAMLRGGPGSSSRRGGADVPVCGLSRRARARRGPALRARRSTGAPGGRQRADVPPEPRRVRPGRVEHRRARRLAPVDLPRADSCRTSTATSVRSPATFACTHSSPTSGASSTTAARPSASEPASVPVRRRELRARPERRPLRLRAACATTSSTTSTRASRG